jgi:hypothetical protein
MRFKAAGSSGRWFRSISMFLLCRPLESFQFQRKVHPRVDQFSQPFVIGNLFAHLHDAFRADKPAAALPTPAIAQLVVRPMSTGILRVLAVAAGSAADIVLLADTSRVHRPQVGQFLFDLLHSWLDL